MWSQAYYLLFKDMKFSAFVVMLNHGLVDPGPHVTWEPEGHVEFFSRWKADLEEAPKLLFWLLL